LLSPATAALLGRALRAANKQSTFRSRAALVETFLAFLPPVQRSSVCVTALYCGVVYACSFSHCWQRQTLAGALLLRGAA